MLFVPGKDSRGTREDLLKTAQISGYIQLGLYWVPL